jgi:NADPH:quinone reductase-like Zn-dependent oxidoreductase
MKAAQFNGSGSDPLLVIADVPRPVPGPDEVLVQVCAAGVTPTELRWSPTLQNRDGSPRRHAIPGHEFSGTIAELGSGVREFSPGDAVFGMNDWFIDGATAEFCLAAASSIVRKPRGLSFEQAAAVPIGALTAWQGLVDRAHLRAGERLLVHGAAGAVGLFAVQFGAQLGAEVIATASARHRKFVTELGASQVLDYATEPFDQSGCDFDVIFDTVGGDTLQRSWPLLNPGGRMVTIASGGADDQSDPRIKAAFFIVEPNSQQLADIGNRLDAGTLFVFVDAEVSLEQASAAYARQVRRLRGYGKVVVTLSCA